MLRRLWLQSCVVSSHFNRTFIELYCESAVESHTDTILLFGDYNSAAVYWIITFILDILKGI